MSLNNVFCFDHLPVGNIDTISLLVGRGWNYGGFPGTIITTEGSARTPTLAYLLEGNPLGANAGRWLALASAVTGTRMDLAHWRIPQGDVFDVTRPRSIFGFRMRKTPTVNTITLLYFANSVILSSVNDAGKFSDNTDYYVEVVIDRIENSVSVYADGVFYKKSPVNSTQINTPTTPIIFHDWSGKASTASSTLYIKDLYFIDDTEDDTPCTRLGAISFKRIFLSSVNAPGWSGNASSTSNSTIGSASVANAPVTSSPDTRAPLSGILGTFANPVLVDTDRVLAFSAKLSGRRTSSNNAQIQPSFVQGGVEIQGTPAAFATPNVMEFCKNLKVLPLAPDGGPWSIEKFQATQVVLTPVLGE